MKRGAEVVTNLICNLFKDDSSDFDGCQTHSVLCFRNTDATYQLVLHSGWSNFISSSNI